jgi:tryptophan synthase beta chain
MMDLVGYDKYMRGQLSDYEMSEEEIRTNLHQMDGYPKP